MFQTNCDFRTMFRDILLLLSSSMILKLVECFNATNMNHESKINFNQFYKDLIAKLPDNDCHIGILYNNVPLVELKDLNINDLVQKGTFCFRLILVSRSAEAGPREKPCTPMHLEVYDGNQWYHWIRHQKLYQHRMVSNDPNDNYHDHNCIF